MIHTQDFRKLSTNYQQIVDNLFKGVDLMAKIVEEKNREKYIRKAMKTT